MNAPIDSCMMLDVLCQQLTLARDRLVLPFARAASAFVDQSAWQAFGYARASDFTRERLHRSGRWLRDLAALDRAFRDLPALQVALCGDDGKSRIGRCAALLIGRIATPESIDAWIDFARANTVRSVREAVARARRSHSVWPTAAPGPAEAHIGDQTEVQTEAKPEANDAESQDEVRSAVKVAVPGPVLAAFEETLDLHRAVIGRESSVTGFIEALSAESAAELPPAEEVDVRAVSRSRKLREHEEKLARATKLWKDLRDATDSSTNEAIAALSELDDVVARVGRGSPAQLFEQLIALLDIEERLDVQLGKALAAIGDGRSWRALRFAGVGHYGSERLGMSRTSAEDRAGMARWMRTRPNVRSAYENGRLGLESALLVRRILEATRPSEELESAWLERATHITVKRLRDEVRLARRSQLLGPQASSLEAQEEPAPPDLSTVSLGAIPLVPDVSTALIPRHRTQLDKTQFDNGGGPLPIDDHAWQCALQRAYGDGNKRVVRLGNMALGTPIPDVFLRLRLPDDVAQSFVGALELKRRRMAEQAEHDTWESDWNDAPWEATPTSAGHGKQSEQEIRLPSWLAARMFASRGRRVPTWVALLAMLEGYARTWDRMDGAPRRPAAAVYIRAGWRCTAPGCTSRQNLEDHHIVYRSRGGGHELANRTCVCRFHHQQGEHGGLAACRGQAPFDLTWRLGRRDLAQWYRNERLLAPAPGASAVEVDMGHHSSAAPLISQLQPFVTLDLGAAIATSRPSLPSRAR